MTNIWELYLGVEGLIVVAKNPVPMHKQIVRAGYDTIGSAYTAGRQLDNEHLAMLNDLVSRLSRDARVLDAGCGAGVPVTRWLSERVQVTGVDISDAQITAARRAVPQVEFICADMTQMDFLDESFDAICSLHSVIHIPREEHRPLLRTFHRMLKPEGLMLLCMGSGDWPGEVEEFFGAPMYWSHYDAETNLALTQECGFGIAWSRMVTDGLDPEAASAHLFILAQKMDAVALQSHEPKELAQDPMACSKPPWPGNQSRCVTRRHDSRTQCRRKMPASYPTCTTAYFTLIEVAV